MKRGLITAAVLGIIGMWWGRQPMTVCAEIASENAFEGAVWEKIIEDDREGGVLQSMCATEDYIICLENYAEDLESPDIIKAYYRNNKDAQGNPVKQYTLAKRVAEMSYEHSNGMAYNPNTKEIAVALYSNLHPENRGCLYIMDSETLEFKTRVKISEDYNILGIGYDEENERYVIQTNADGGYSFKILDGQFQIIEDLGQYAGTAKGDNFQDLCVSGDYIINFPLTLGMGIGDYINMYSISKRMLVSDAQLDFQFENVVGDEPEGICELEPGVFAAVVNEERVDGSRKFCVYKTMVPYNFSAEELKAADDGKQSEETAGKETDGKEKHAEKSSAGKLILKIVLVLAAAFAGFLVFYARLVAIRRERRRKLERERRKRQRIQEMQE